jgi:acetylornithine/LysW-gamma-L-lysine aminotransferase
MPECPVCAADVSLADDAEVGELMECPDCGTELEVTGLELAAIEFMERHYLAEQERRKGERLRAALEPRLPAVVRELRQIGLMVGIELKQKTQPYLATLLEHGVFALPAGPTVIRLLPPLVITDEQLDIVADRLIEVLTDG